MNELKFVAMSEEHLESVVKIEGESFIEPWPLTHFKYEMLHNDFSNCVVLLLDEVVIGYIVYYITFNSSTIATIAVEKKHRGKGYAGKLLLVMEDSFIKEGDDVVESSTLEVRKSNVAAYNLYKKNGYSEVCIKPKYYGNGEDAIYMVKRYL